MISPGTGFGTTGQSRHTQRAGRFETRVERTRLFFLESRELVDKTPAAYEHDHAHVTMKTERVTLLTTKEFKSFLRAEAQREGVSVAELVRVRCEHKPHPDEVELVRLTAELREALRTAKSSLRKGLSEAQSTLAELRAGRVGGTPADHPQLSRSHGK
jgi:hypothetical protein